MSGGVACMWFRCGGVSGCVGVVAKFSVEVVNVLYNLAKFTFLVLGFKCSS